MVCVASIVYKIPSVYRVCQVGQASQCTNAQKECLQCHHSSQLVRRTPLSVATAGHCEVKKQTEGILLLIW